MKKFKSLSLIVSICISVLAICLNPIFASAKTAASSQAFTIYKDDKVEIGFKSISENGIVFRVSNLSNTNLTIQADSIAINGISTNSIVMSENIAPQNTADATAVISQTDILNITSVDRVSGQLRVVDFINRLSYTAVFNVAVNESPGYYEKDFQKPLLFSDDKVDIYYYSTEKNGVQFLVRNKTELNVTIQADSLAINDTDINGLIMSEQIAPHSVGTVRIRCTVDAALQDAKTISGQLRIIDFTRANFSSYGASFASVPVAQ